MFKAGDRVRICAKPPSRGLGMSCYPNSHWITVMDDLCSKTGQIRTVETFLSSGIRCYAVAIDGRPAGEPHYKFIDEWLTLVEDEKKQEISVKMKLEDGDIVMICEDPPDDWSETPTWDETMTEFCGLMGTVMDIEDNGHVHVEVPGNSAIDDYVFNAKWLTPLSEVSADRLTKSLIERADEITKTSKPAMDSLCGRKVKVIAPTDSRPTIWTAAHSVYIGKDAVIRYVAVHANTAGTHHISFYLDFPGYSGPQPALEWDPSWLEFTPIVPAIDNTEKQALLSKIRTLHADCLDKVRDMQEIIGELSNKIAE